MSRVRKALIVEKASPMPETASRIADGLHDCAAAFRGMTAVLAWLAAAEHSESHGRQKEMAAVILRFATEGYFSTKVDGVKVSEADQEQALAMFNKLFPLKGRR